LKRRAIIAGAAGRDFHNFNVFFRNNPDYEVVAFTAGQIPFIANRRYPRKAAGPRYPQGIPIIDETELSRTIKEKSVHDVFFAYSDVTNQHVMQLASTALSSGASFHLLGPKDVSLKAKLPVVSVVATRTGAGKSTISLRIAKLLRDRGLRFVVVRHPMTYGDFDHPVQRFSSMADLQRMNLTVEEIEEYERHVRQGNTILAGFDYVKILRTIKDADVILWDGGNNDFSFYIPDFTVTVVDPLRLEDIQTYYPTMVNIRAADLLVVNKANLVPVSKFDQIRKHLSSLNTHAQITFVESKVVAEDDVPLKGRRVLVVEDGPSVTHGGLTEGAGATLAREKGAIMVNPRRYCKGSIAEAFGKYPHIHRVLPALGYSKEQLLELEETINRVPCDVVILGTPTDLTKYIRVNRPVVRCSIELKEPYSPTLTSILSDWIDSHLVAKKA